MASAVSPLPAIGHEQMLVFLLQIGVLLAAAVALGMLAARLGLPALVGELCAGVLLGPSLFGEVLPSAAGWLLPRDPAQMHLLTAVAQLGVLLLVAITGAHIDLGLVRRRGRAIGWVSAGSVLLPLGLGVALGLLLPASLIAPDAGRGTFALFIGIAIAISALPVIAKTLLDMGLLHRDVGQLIVGAAAVSDIIGWLLLSVVSTMVVSGTHLGLILRTVGFLLAALAVAAFVVRPVARRVVRHTERARQPGMTITAMVVMVMLCAAGTQALGMESILGAFLCGIVISSLGPGSRRTFDTVRTFVMSTLAPLFFVTAGLQVDLGALARPPVLIAAAATLAVAVLAKFAGGYIGARLGRLGHGEALATGAGLNARGVVEIVIATAGLQLGILTTAAYTIVVLIAVVTSVMAPPFLRHATRRIPKTTTESRREREFASL
ncbi:cation:proton antiporter [Streptomyces sp. NPDC055794]